MKSRMIFFKDLLIMLLLSVSVDVFSQTLEPNLKFGKPTDAELTMSTYAPDPDADALVLCSQTSTYYEIRSGIFLLMTDVKVRIKVLRDEGKSYANVIVPYIANSSNQGYRERVVGVKATAFNMENGKVVKTKMTSDMEFTENVDKDNKLLKFTVPQVKVGTVFEYQYRKESDYFFHIDTWLAQQSIPTYYASYELELPEWFQFNVAETGFYNMEKQRQSTSVSFVVGDQPLRCVADKYIFVAHELPGVKDDDYIWCVADYCNKVEAELRSIEIPGAVYEYYTQTWEDIGRQLMGDNDFGGRLKRGNLLKEEQAKESIPSNASPREKTAALYQLLKKHYKWNGEYKLFGKGTHSMKKDGEGSNADLNFVLLNMLNDAGLEAYPVLMRLRTRGRLPVSHPTMKELSTFVVGVMENDTSMMFIDGSADDGYIDVLPARLLVSQARVVKPDGSGFFVNLQKTALNKMNIAAQLSFDENGGIAGEAHITYQGNGALAERRQYREAKDSMTFVRETGERFGISITDFVMQGRDEFSPMVREEIKFKSHVDTSGGLIYLNPFFFRPVKESPFKSTVRDIPVEYPYPSMVSLSVNIRLPEGCTVDECPENLSLQTPDGGLVAKVVVGANYGAVIVQVKLNINKTLFLQTEYNEMCQFYEALVKKCNEMVVIKK